MDFGRVPGQDPAGVDFSLGPDDDRTRGVLSNTPAPQHASLRRGAPVWSVPAWLGTLYPPGTPRSAWLSHYARRFDAVELNATFYAIPARARCLAWASAVASNPDFRFCPKVPRALSHARGLKPTLEDVRAFVDAVEGFGEHLGPCLLQVHEHIGPRDLVDLLRLVDLLPRTLPLALEVRHPDFFGDRRLSPGLFDALAARGVGAVVTDVSGRRDVCHASLPTPRVFVRLVCNRLHGSDLERAAAWAAQLARWRAQGLLEAHLFVHQPDDAEAPPVLDAFDAALGRAPSAPSPPPPTSSPQLTLF
ncbi:MAG: DUF72 domain-containing protein [Bradymonadia bacterium]